MVSNPNISAMRAWCTLTVLFVFALVTTTTADATSTTPSALSKALDVSIPSISDLFSHVRDAKASLMRTMGDTTACVTAASQDSSCLPMIKCLNYDKNATGCAAQGSACAWDDKLGVCTMPFTTSYLNAFCSSSGCVKTLNQTAACVGVDMANMAKYLCVTNSSGNYCISEVDNAFTAFLAIAQGTFDSSIVAAVCSNCVRRLLTAISSASSSMFDLICTQSDGHYCLADGYVGNLIKNKNSYQNSNSLGNSHGLPVALEDLKNASVVQNLCKDRCFFKVLGNVLATTSDNSSAKAFNALSKFLCSMGTPVNSSTPQYCITAYMNLGGVLGTTDLSSLNSCSALQTLYDQLGCCLTSAWKMFQTLLPMNALDTMNGLLKTCPQFNVSACGSGNGTVMPITKVLKIQAKWSVVSANLEVYKATIKQDLATNLGIPTDYIVSVELSAQTSTLASTFFLQQISKKFDVEAADSGVQATVQIQASSDSETSSIGNDLTTQVNANMLTFPSTSSQYGSTIDTGSGSTAVTATTSTTTATTTLTSTLTTTFRNAAVVASQAHMSMLVALITMVISFTFIFSAP